MAKASEPRRGRAVQAAAAAAAPDAAGQPGTAPDAAASRLHELLGADALRPLRERLRRAYARAEPGQRPTALRLSGLDALEADTLQALSGRLPRPTTTLQVDLAALDVRLRAAGLAAGLREALETLDGPIIGREAREARAAGWSTLAQEAPHPRLRLLLGQARALGLLKRLAAGDAAVARALCTRTAAVLARLPAAGEPRARLAACCLGDAHALDDARPVATLVLAALRQGAADEDAESARALWAGQGVTVNELARPALALNLPWPGDAGTHGEPQYWSLRRLLRQPPAWRVAQRDVFVCENPNLVALAADALGAGCAPLACTDGMPAAAQRALLQQLRAAGARLHYHGDFDWPGITIGNRMVQMFGATPWRFRAADYGAGLAAHGHETAALQGPPVEADWDPALAPAMAAAGQALAEEALFEALHDDLAGTGPTRR